MTSRPPAWSPSDRQLLVDLFEAENTVPAIAKRLKRTVQAVTLKIRRLRAAGQITRIGHRPSIWGDDRVRRLLEMHQDGHPREKIAAELGCTVKAIGHILTRLRKLAKIPPATSGVRLSSRDIDRVIAERPSIGRPPLSERVGTAPIFAEPIIYRAPIRSKPPALPLVVRTDHPAASYLNSRGRDVFTPTADGFWMLNGLRRLDESQLLRRAQSFGFQA